MKKRTIYSKFSLVWMLIAALFFATACSKDEDNPPVITVEDGFYVVGAATTMPTVDANGLMSACINENGQVARTGLYEKFIALKGGMAFNITKVYGTVLTNYGPGTMITYNPDYRGEQPRVTLQVGGYVATGTFSVPTDGLYHIILDNETQRVAIIPVSYWAIIGGATELGWSDTQMPQDGAFSQTAMSFKATGVALRMGEFKLRYSGGWKVNIDDTLGANALVRINTNFGGVFDTTTMKPTLVPGGSNYVFPAAKEGIYTITMNWTFESGYAVTFTKTGDVTPAPTYPDSMYIAGAAVSYGWSPGIANSEMHKCAGGIPTEGIYWKICHITGGQGFKLSNFNWTEPNLNYGLVDEWDVNGVTVTADGDNWTIAESGMYMVVLNLRDDMVKVSIKPAEVYGIGLAFGGWDAGVAANKFTVTDTTLVSPALPATENIRMYASHSWIPDWWNAEFNVYTTTIEYRNDGGDQAAVPGTVGQIVTLHFDDNTGFITTP